LEDADISEAVERGDYRPAEVFSAKGRDGKTDIWGIIVRPRDFDPNKKYPVVEDIYAGPQGSFVPKTFGGGNRYQAMADLGFIVVKIDGMGTANRSKAFHDECWHDLKDAGFADRILWMKAAAEKYPYMDLSRVGVHGGSAGGQNAMAALLFHPEFYKVAVAGCGCHDNRMDKSSWNEQWMGYPVGPQYSECSNIDNAWRLEGKLLLIVGELDDNVPVESTFRTVDALIRADKDFDFIMVPGAGHGMGGNYGSRRMREFFQEHLLGMELPNRNLDDVPEERRGPRREGRGVGAIRPVSGAAAEYASPFVEEAATQTQTAEPTQESQRSGERQGTPTADQQTNATAPASQPLVLTGLERRETRTARIAARYRADRGGLQRFYLAPEAPEVRARMRRFYADWLAALTALPPAVLMERERAEIADLKAEISEEFAQLEEQSRADAQLEPLLPFSGTIYQLIADRLAVKPMDAQAAAAQVDSISGKVADAEAWVKARRESATANAENAQAPSLTADMLKRGASRVGQLRQQLERWHRFYDGYDPLFMWWMKAPYADATKALDDYATFLTEQSTQLTDVAETSYPDPQAAVPDPGAIAGLAGNPSSDVPDLMELLNEERGYMELVWQRYQAETGGGRGRGRGRGGRGGRGERGDAQTGREDAGARRGDAQANEDQESEGDSAANRAAGRGDRRRGGEAAAQEDENREAAQQGGGQGDEGRGRAGRRGRGRQGGRGRGEDAPEAREQARARATRWLEAMKQLDFDSFSRADKLDYLMLKRQLERQLGGGAGGGGRRGDRGEAQVLDESGMRVIPPVGREALMADLAREMIDYTPEQLIEIGKREMAWCRAELIKASRGMGLGDDWMAAVEKVKTLHVKPGEQPQTIQGLAWEAINYLREHDLLTIPNVATEIFGMQMMSPERQLVNPFFTGGGSISVSFPTDTMTHTAKLQSMKGNNIPFARATVHHELIPGHNLQGFMGSRYNNHRSYGTPFWGEGWALYWELQLYERGFPKTPEDRVGFLVWRSHRCARIVFSLSYQMGQMMPQQCVDYLVANVGFERKNSEAEVLRSFNGSYAPLYQAAYLLGGIQLKQLHTEVVKGGKMPEKQFHDAIIRGGSMPIKMVRFLVTDVPVTREGAPDWKFYGPVEVAEAAPPTP
jgi:uncharacterized protein (DUF885 family)/dienelactone hydrolase